MKKYAFCFMFCMFYLGYMVDGYADNSFMKFMNVPMGKLRTSSTYEYTYYGKADVENQDTDLTVQDHKTSLLLPMMKKDNSDFSLYTTFDYQKWDTNAVLSNTSIEVPNDVYKLDLLPAYRHLFDNGWLLGVMGQFGSESDKLFNSSDELLYGGRAFLKVPHGERNAWMFFLDYSMNREFLRYIPLPGFGYMYNPDENLQIMAGVPFAFIKYKPVEKLEFSASYFPIHTVNAKVSYDIYENWKIFTDFNWESERYFRADREDEDDRVYYYQKKAGAGISFAPNRGMSFILKGGYSFDRYLYEADSYEHSHNNRVDFDGTYYIEAKASIAF